MKRFNLLAATIVLALTSMAGADDYGRLRAISADQDTAPNPFLATPAAGYPSTAAPGTFTDFPPYPIGYTSYRGLGYQGYCCEKNPPCAQKLWGNYCAQKGDCHAAQKHGCGLFGSHCGLGCAPKCGLGCGSHCGGGCGSSCGFGCGWHGDVGCGHGCGLGLGGFLHLFGGKHGWCCYPDCCNSSCGGPGASWWPVAPHGHKRFGGWLRGWRGGKGGDVIYEGYPDEAGLQATEIPTPAPEPENAATPEASYPDPQLSVPGRSAESRDNLPSLLPEDRSAWRTNVKRLLAMPVSF